MMALTAMDKLLFWLGIGAALKGAGSKPTVFDGTVQKIKVTNITATTATLSRAVQKNKWKKNS